jgi:hypothetical protein
MIPKAEPHMEAVNNTHAFPPTLDQPSAPRFWVSVVGIGILTGLSVGLLTKLLEWVQRALWGGNGREILDAAQHTAALRIFLVLLAAGAVTGIAQVVLRKLSSGNDIDTAAAIWFTPESSLRFALSGAPRCPSCLLVWVFHWVARALRATHLVAVCQQRQDAIARDVAGGARDKHQI